jgi:hypothetical protein
MQQAAQPELQQFGVLPPQLGVFAHLWVLVLQMAVVQPVLSAQSAFFVHWMQPPLAGSQVRPEAHNASLGVCEQVPFEQLSVVHAVRSSQSVSLQHAAQPMPLQHSPLAQPDGTHFPAVHVCVTHGSLLLQSLLLAHCAVATHFWVAGLHVSPAGHTDGSATLLHVPCVHESFVQNLLSSQSPAEQQEPHVAEVLSALAQHVAPPVVASHNGGFAHFPDTH